MAESIKVRLELNECTKLEHTDYLTTNDRTNRDSLVDVIERIILSLLVAERDSLLLRIEILNIYMNLITNGKNFRRMMNVVPGQLGYVDETINTTDVNKCTEVCEASYNTIVLLILLDSAPYFLSLCLTLIVEKCSSGTGNSQTTLVRIELCDEDLNCLTLVSFEIIYNIQY